MAALPSPVLPTGVDRAAPWKVFLVLLFFLTEHTSGPLTRASSRSHTFVKSKVIYATVTLNDNSVFKSVVTDTISTQP